ncbi:MAG TPA: hypothetical protein PLW65_33750, partial [Pseudomonadota bacterium]|nr:hypothetical protein [Pseudomonadota bacterium]
MIRACLSFLLASTLFAQARCATFTIAYFDTPPNAQAAIEHAAGIWGGILVSDVPIKVTVQW